jgi:hypothetical protein
MSSPPGAPPKFFDAALYASAAISYVALAISHKWLLNWIVGPLWLLGWVWGLPALWNLLRGRPVRPRRDRPGVRGEPETGSSGA